jgi:hypothetical protein
MIAPVWLIKDLLSLTADLFGSRSQALLLPLQ